MSNTYAIRRCSYLVLNGHTLGYRLGGSATLWPLAGSVLRGGHDPKNGPVAIMAGVDTIRPATLADFKAYRVSPVGHLA